MLLTLLIYHLANVRCISRGISQSGSHLLKQVHVGTGEWMTGALTVGGILAPGWLFWGQIGCSTICSSGHMTLPQCQGQQALRLLVPMRVRSRYPTSAGALYKANRGFTHFITIPRCSWSSTSSQPWIPGTTESQCASPTWKNFKLHCSTGITELFAGLMKMGPVPDALKDLLML